MNRQVLKHGHTSALTLFGPSSLFIPDWNVSFSVTHCHKHTHTHLQINKAHRQGYCSVSVLKGKKSHIHFKRQQRNRKQRR